MPFLMPTSFFVSMVLLNLCKPPYFLKTEVTFIVLDKSLPNTPNVETRGGAMAGDVNVFISRTRFFVYEWNASSPVE